MAGVNPDRKSRALPLAVAVVVQGLAGATEATASSIRCEGEMRLSECRAVPQDGYPWAASSQPTFSVSCTGCPGPSRADGGPPPTCMPYPPMARQFTLSVGGQSYRNSSTALGVPTVYFEDTLTECDGEKLFRYKGPLQPGKTHEIALGGHDAPELPITFYVADAPADPAPDAQAADSAARGDTPSASGGQPAATGCACSVHRAPPASRSLASPLLLVALAARLTRRKRRRPGVRQPA